MNDYQQNVNISIETVTGQETDKYNVIKLVGNLDKIGLDTIRGKIDAEVEACQKDFIVMDFSQLNFINSESIGFLLTIYYRLLKKQKKLVIVGAPENINDVLSVIGLLKIIDSYTSLDEFKTTIQ
jgi:stage II sporulation protein AA (anti-sigma F factor antagonist)